MTPSIQTELTFFVVCSLFLLANLAILGLNLKLYTEILKDKSQDRRQHG